MMAFDVTPPTLSLRIYTNNGFSHIAICSPLFVPDLHLPVASFCLNLLGYTYSQASPYMHDSKEMLRILLAIIRVFCM